VEASASVEDYLKTVWRLSSPPDGGSDGRVAPSELARALGVSAPSVSAMVRRLRSAGLLVDTPAGTLLELTPDGVRTALDVVRRHRLLETFLVQVLGLGWDEVHAEAEILEHALTPRVERAIAAHLGEPARDPHGDPIPPPSELLAPGVLAPGAVVRSDHREDWGQPLAAADADAVFDVERVEDVDPTVLRHLADLGIIPGTRLHLAGRDDHGGPLWVRVCSPGGESDRIPLGAGLVRRVHGRTAPAGAQRGSSTGVPTGSP